MTLAWNDDYLKSMIEENHCIDKTQELERGITGFPSVFIEGAAASGKTFAVQLFVSRHPEITPVYFLMDEKCDTNFFLEDFARKLDALRSRMKNEQICVIFENVNGELPNGVAAEIASFIRCIPSGSKAIIAGREKPAKELIPLLWKNKMQLVSQVCLNFTVKEIEELAAWKKSSLNPDEIWQETGGWAGCVDLLLRLSLNDRKQTVSDLMNRYEIRTYISEEIIGSLSEDEREIMRRGSVCPWLNEEMCRDVWNITWAGDILENLERKGFLIHESRKKRWKTARLFSSDKRLKKERDIQSPLLWKRLGDWYESHDSIKEMLYCLDKSGDEEAYRRGLLRHYDKIPFLEIPHGQIKEWKENTPEACYLRGMYCYFEQNFSGLEKEIHKLERLHPVSGKVREIYLNLTFVQPDLSLDDWLTLLEKGEKEEENIRLYNVLGGSCTFLCGLRDLSGMFGCSKKEEKRKARIWKMHLCKETWIWLMLARLDYYVEIGREKDLAKEERCKFYTGGGIFRETINR